MTGGHWESFWMQFWSPKLEVAKKGATMKIASPSSIIEWYRQIFWQHQNCYLPPSLGRVDLVIPLYQVHTYLPWPLFLHTPVCTHYGHFSTIFSEYLSKLLSLKCFGSVNLFIAIKRADTSNNGVCFYLYSCILFTFHTVQLLV